MIACMPKSMQKCKKYSKIPGSNNLRYRFRLAVIETTKKVTIAKIQYVKVVISGKYKNLNKITKI